MFIVAAGVAAAGVARAWECCQLDQKLAQEKHDHLVESISAYTDAGTVINSPVVIHKTLKPVTTRKTKKTKPCRYCGRTIHPADYMGCYGCSAPLESEDVAQDKLLGIVTQYPEMSKYINIEKINPFGSNVLRPCAKVMVWD